MKNYVSGGEVLDLAAPYAVSSGGGMKIGDIIAIAAVDAAITVVIAGYVQGVFDVTAEGAGSGQAWAVGDKIYWDDTNKRFTKTSTSNTLAGYAVGAKLTADVVGRLRLCPVA
jgi:predicted RecA/RadA family phage recombinase